MKMALANYKKACFSMLLEGLLLGFECQNKLESQSFSCEPRCEPAASTLNSVVLQPFNIARIMVATF